MSLRPLLIAAIFVVAHIALVAPFVPFANVLPAGLGALSMSSMALSLTLAARWRIVDRVMGGPDKSYAAHRWLGFFALGGALGHWSLASSVGAGVLPMLAESGEATGTFAVFGLIVMTAAAMMRAIPYHLWKASHMLMGPIFLLAAYHTFFVASPLAVGVTPWTLMAILSVVGLLAWGQTLLRKTRVSQRVTVERAERFDGGVDLTLRAHKTLPGFRPGQFATIARNHARSEAHPFTIAGGDATSRRLVIRATGDWTNALVGDVKPGDEFRLGRSVGRFLPQTHTQRSEQLWIAGGVGITPFLAALEKMRADGGARVTLIHCIRSSASAGVIEDLEHHAARLPQLTLLVLDEAAGEKLSDARLMEVLRGMSESSQLYLCGPEGLKATAEAAWKAVGMAGRVHSERFDFRNAFGQTELVQTGKAALKTARNRVARLKVPSRASIRS